MTKRSRSLRSRKSATVPPAPAKNPFKQNKNFNEQTRKVLGQHYRAKYGVK